MRNAFDYAILRLVPRIERGEALNVGVVLHCRVKRFLAAKVALDRRMLELLDPHADGDEIARHLAVFPLIAAGEAGSGPIGQLPREERFAWLVAPRSTIIQPTPLHTGLCDEPAHALERLFGRLVSH